MWQVGNTLRFKLVSIIRSKNFLLLIPKGYFFFNNFNDNGTCRTRQVHDIFNLNNFSDKNSRALTFLVIFIGTHIKCSDDTIKQILSFLNEKMNFIIEDDGLDLIVKSDQVENIKIELEKILEENRQATSGTPKTTNKD
ncbi:hypothetical protein C1646_751264 [Rhizophagus diaphanus]|nr:hypothetical protein C1646_751264 [Rhizophagus diaphanus] [Rhizophagus sp. MUCL 43196]